MAIPYFDADGDNSAQTIKANSGHLNDMTIINTNATSCFVQLFDALAANVTVGTTTPNYVILVPANGGVIKDYPECGLKFKTGICYACTTTATGNGDPTTGLTVSASYN